MGAQKVSPGLLPPPPRYPGVTCRKTKNLRFFRSQISDLRENVCISDNLLSHRGLVTRENLETVRFPLKNLESENWIQRPPIYILNASSISLFVQATFGDLQMHASPWETVLKSNKH